MDTKIKDSHVDIEKEPPGKPAICCWLPSTKHPKTQPSGCRQPTKMLRNPMFFQALFPTSKIRSAQRRRAGEGFLKDFFGGERIEKKGENWWDLYILYGFDWFYRSVLVKVFFCDVWWCLMSIFFSSDVLLRFIPRIWTLKPPNNLFDLFSKGEMDKRESTISVCLIMHICYLRRYAYI